MYMYLFIHTMEDFIFHLTNILSCSHITTGRLRQMSLQIKKRNRDKEAGVAWGSCPTLWHL